MKAERPVRTHQTPSKGDGAEEWVRFWIFSEGRANRIHCYCCSVDKSRPVFYDPVDCSTPGFPVFQEFAWIANPNPA